MTKNLFSIFLLIVSMLPMTQATALPTDKSMIDVLTLQQQSPEHGDIIVTVAKQSLRVDIPRSGTTVLTNAPDWRVSTFSNERKTEFVTSFADFEKNGLTNLRGVPRRIKDYHLNQMKSAPTVMFLVPCNRYHVLQIKPTGMAPQVLDQMLYLEKSKKSKAASSNHGVEIVETVERYPVQIAEVLTRLYDVPVTSGLPIAEIEEYPDGRVRFNLKTKSIVKASVPGKFFDKPASFKQLRAFGDVTSSAKTQKNAEDIFNSLGLGEGFGSADKLKAKPKTKP